MKKNRSYSVAVLVLFLLLGAALFFALCGGRGGQISYSEMACSFEGEKPDCLDHNAEWSGGLLYFDSLLFATQDTLETLKSLLWTYWDIEFAGAGTPAVSLESVLPLQVLHQKKSGCMGLVWLAMMVAEKRNIHLQTILLPGHVFLKFGTRNLEPNRRGYSYTDEEYREKYKEGKWTGFEFKPLTPPQFIGLAAFNAGNFFLEEEPRKALAWYRMAESFFPEYPGIPNNLRVAKIRLHQ